MEILAFELKCHACKALQAFHNCTRNTEMHITITYLRTYYTKNCEPCCIMWTADSKQSGMDEERAQMKESG